MRREHLFSALGVSEIPILRFSGAELATLRKAMVIAEAARAMLGDDDATADTELAGIEHAFREILADGFIRLCSQPAPLVSGH